MTSHPGGGWCASGGFPAEAPRLQLGDQVLHKQVRIVMIMMIVVTMVMMMMMVMMEMMMILITIVRNNHP